MRYLSNGTVACRVALSHDISEVVCSNPLTDNVILPLLGSEPRSQLYVNLEQSFPWKEENSFSKDLCLVLAQAKDSDLAVLPLVIPE